MGQQTLAIVKDPKNKAQEAQEENVLGQNKEQHEEEL